jgi:hypothetical protein
MKLFSAALALLVIALGFLLLQQHVKQSEIQAALLALTHDRDDMRGQLRRLSTQLEDAHQALLATAARERSAAAAASTAVAATRSAEAIAAPVATPGVSVTAPAGWFRNGKNAEKYVVGVDSTQSWGGMPSAYVKSIAETKDGFGGMMQTAAADSYAGKRVKLSAWVKTEDANDGGGHLWFRIDGQQQGQMLGFDNMQNRAVKGTSDWQEASVVLDVPAAGASKLAYGFFVQGNGKMWVNGQTMQVVGPDVPTTNMREAMTPAAPTNLGFDPNRPK